MSASAKRLHCTNPGCDYTAKRPSILAAHVNSHALTFACHWPSCTSSFTSSSERSTHFGIHTKDKKSLCKWEGCGYKTAHRYNLKRHVMRHDGARPHICTAAKTCDLLSFATLEGLEQHRKDSHPQDQEEEEDVDFNAGEQDLLVTSQPVASTSRNQDSTHATDASVSRKPTLTSFSTSAMDTSTAASTSNNPDAPPKPRRQRCSQLHCPFTTRDAARLAKHSTRHTAVLPFLCLEKKCLAAFATATEEEQHGRTVHKRTAEPKAVSKKRKRKQDDDDKEREFIDLTQGNEVDDSDITPVTPAPKRRKIEGLMTPPATEVPRKRKGKEREVVLTAKDKGKGKERAVSPSVSVSSFHAEESSSMRATTFHVGTASSSTYAMPASSNIASASTNAIASSSKLPTRKAGPFELLRERESAVGIGKKRKLGE
ncbi:hypothetical protein CYLTODRAFT_27131 [Cylindrobasidium torrendii FP15055 ss-10]|uniref:C2H2-type domain-containing protein n=1 Tax=Cylindrobasidium torrendii FP15055 ss-10 TaxID=1314674 RepID=A0A0D7B8U4_9AGAR|nr:hypothetical protein CYLTODRAFT_27131 [Cylindrobasidium torrendii FP15055 ss-10]